MYFYDYKESTIDKYEINVDREKLIKLRREIIDNCSIIEHHEYQSTIIPAESLKIRNLNYKRNGIMEYKDVPDEPLFYITYDEYKFPQLVGIIDRILDDDVDETIKLYNGKITDDYISFDEKISKISQELDDIDNLNIKEKRKKLEELENMLNLAKLNSNQKSVLDYYSKVKSLISFKLVDSISKGEVDKVWNFFEKDKVKNKTK